MTAARKLFVLDDEPIVCDLCRTAFSERGWAIESSDDPAAGMRRLSAGGFSAALVDLALPGADGLALLADLRRRRPELPVVVLVGPAGEAAAAGARALGGVELLERPFAPGDLAAVVDRALGLGAPQPAAEPARPRLLFLDDAWVHGGPERATAGLFVPDLVCEAAGPAQLPSPGQLVFRGLPLALLRPPGEPPRLVPSPVTGEVLEVNAAWPAGAGADAASRWIARIRPERWDEDRAALRPRCVVLAAAPSPQTDERRRCLERLGCEVRAAPDAASVEPALAPSAVLIADSATLGDDGVEVARRLRGARPDVRIVVLGGGDPQRERAWRLAGVFFYALEPFADGEIVDVLADAFRPVEPPRPLAPRSGRRRLVRRLAFTPRGGGAVTLLPAEGLLLEDEGLGAALRDEILARGCASRVDVVEPRLRQAVGRGWSDTTGPCVLLVEQDRRLLPGSLARAASLPALRPGARPVGTLAIQPPEPGDPPPDPRLLRALAARIVDELERAAAPERPDR